MFVCMYVYVCTQCMYVCVCLFVWLVVCLLTLACFLATFNCTPWRWHYGYIEFLGQFHQDHTSNALLMAKEVALVAHPGDRCSPTGRLAGVIYFSILQALNWPWPDRWAAIECFKKTRWFSGNLQAVTPDRWIRSMRFQHCNRGWVQFTLFFLTEPDTSESGPQYQWLGNESLTFFNMFYGRHVEILNSLYLYFVFVYCLKWTKGRGIHK